MKILFVGLIAHYTEGLKYQDNCFNKVLVEDGHEIVFLSDVQRYEDGVLTFSKKSDFIDETGARIIRVPYLFCNFIGSKFKIFQSIYKYLEEFKPDIIFCHSPQYFNVFEVIKYKKNNSNVLVYADTHTSFSNAKMDRWYFNILYRFYYKALYKSIEPYLEKYFYIGLEERDFSEKVFKADKSIMEFLPLSGEDISIELYSKYRNEIRNKFGFKSTDIILFHSGKFDKDKNTIWVLDALKKINNNNIKLLIAGYTPNDNIELIRRINSEMNVINMGWIHGNELIKYLCACDLYCQPGSPSVTLQTAICCKTPIICFKHSFYSYLYDYGSIIWIHDENELVNAIDSVMGDRKYLEELRNFAKKNSYKLDTRYLLKKALEI